MKVVKIFTFDAAHRLSNYEGKCFNLHGHTYRLEITVSGKLNSMGFVVDFGDLKKIVNEMLDNLFDHKTILKDTDAMNLKLQAILPEGSVYMAPYNPTAENMVNDIFERLRNSFPVGVILEKIRLYETATNYAEVNKEEVINYRRQ